MRTIYKYSFEVKDIQRVYLPLEAEILTVQSQQGNPYMWALVDPENKLVERVFEVFGTGHPIQEDMGTDRKYIGTFQLQDGFLVFHLFERLN
jgi:hypothetical protein